MTRPLFALSLGFGGVILATQIAHSQGKNPSAVTAGSGTITMTRPDGRPCLMASGADYKAATEELSVGGPI